MTVKWKLNYTSTWQEMKSRNLTQIKESDNVQEMSYGRKRLLWVGNELDILLLSLLQMQIIVIWRPLGQICRDNIPWMVFLKTDLVRVYPTTRCYGKKREKKSQTQEWNRQLRRQDEAMKKAMVPRERDTDLGILCTGRERDGRMGLMKYIKPHLICILIWSI